MRPTGKLQRHGPFRWTLASLSAVLLLAVLSGCQKGTESGASSAAFAAPSQIITADLTYAPNVPPPITRTAPARVVVNLEAQEKTAELAPGVTYNFWMYNGHVPGPFIRVRVGDVLEVHLKNLSPDKTHTVDFHAVTGPGGGAPILMANPGEETVGEFKMLHAGLFVYHCAANPMPAHMSNGLYGMVLVEPEGGLPKVDREYYVMQSEFYTEGKVGEPGLQAYSSSKAAAETPEYVVFNGNAGSLMGANMLPAKVGETVRIFFGNAGPNKISAFHVVGTTFRRIYRDGGMKHPDEDIQTALVAPGSTAIAEFPILVPGKYTLLDHSIFRTERGAMGMIMAEGPDAPGIYHKLK
jgi:nitrite reductase (NO-forming)